MADSAPLTARARLLEAAVALALGSGPAALTGRALAGAIGASPSAVNYHFGGRDGLMLAVHGEIAARQAAWRARRLAAAPNSAGAPAWPIVAGCLVDLAVGARAEQLALLDFTTAGGDAGAGLAAAATAERRAQGEFWQALLQRLGRGPEEATIWTATVLSATPLAMLDADAADAFAWIGPALLRLEERLERAASPGLIAWLAPVRPPVPPDRPPGAQRLVDAALQVIAADGLQGLTLRAVAEAAGLSLGSTTYFFDSKAELVRAAFVQLRDEACRAAIQDGMLGERRPREEQSQAEDVANRTMKALAALTLAGARDPDLREVATSLRGLTGQTSTQWLAARGPGVYDRLDGFIGSLVSQGLRAEAGWMSPSASRAELEAGWDGLMDRLFRPSRRRPERADPVLF